MKSTLTNRQGKLSWTKLILLGLLTTGGLIMATPRSASAYALDNYQNVPTDIVNYLRTCNSTVNEVAQYGWISLRGQPLSTTANIPYGTTSIDLQFNAVVYVCTAGIQPYGDVAASRDGTNYKIISSSTSSSFIPGLVNSEVLVSYGNPPNLRFNVNTIPFTYNFSSPAQTNQTINFSINWKAINHVRTPTSRYECVTNPGTINNYIPANYSDFGACNSIGSYDLSMNINVTTSPYGVQGLRRAGVSSPYNSGSLPNGCGSTDMTGYSSTTDNPYFFNSLTGSRTFTASSSVTCSGVLYVRVGYTLCANRTDCHGAAPNTASSVTVPNMNGGYYDLWWHYRIAYPVLSCGNASPLTVEINVPFNMSVTFSNAAGADTFTGGTMNVTISGTPGVIKSSGSVAFSPNPLSGGQTATSLNTEMTGLVATSTGEYTITWTVSGGNVQSALNCQATLSVVSKPYFQVTNGDVSAGTGAAVGNVCPGWGASTSGFVKGWNNSGSGAANRGAGTNLAALSIGTNNQFVSYQGNTGSPWPGLVFSNWNRLNWGGDFRGGIPCPSDYYAQLPSSGTVVPANPFVPPSNNNVYYQNGSLTISGTGFGNVGLGFKPVIFVNGDVNITGPINFAGGATTVSQLPNFYVIAKGNIYISPAVQVLNGVYIAQPLGDGTKGNIYTCSNDLALPSTGPPSRSQLNSTSSVVPRGCKYRTSLTINGALIAKEIKFYRSAGSLSTTGPSEIVNYTPNVWLGVPEVLQGNGLSGCCDAITSLPPVL